MWNKTLTQQDKQDIQDAKDLKRMETHSYWNNNGKYERLYEKLFKLVPSEGKSDNKHIEAIRCISNIYYDFYNNGACNLANRETHESWDGDEYYEYYTYNVRDCYKESVHHIDQYLKDRNDMFFDWTDVDDTELGEMITKYQSDYNSYSENEKILLKLERITTEIIRKAYGNIYN
jgi:hypothetical protein